MTKTAEEEQATKTSEEEQSEESSEPADTVEAVEQFIAEKTKESSAETDETKTETKEKAAEEEEGKEEEKPEGETSPEPTLWIIDKEGKKTPFIVKADGKLHAPDSVEKGLQWGSLGVHASAKTAEINKERVEMEKAKPFLDMIQKAHEEGRLIIDGKPTNVEGKEEVAEESEEGEFPVDAELKKRDDKIDKLEKKDQVRTEAEVMKQITDAKNDIMKEIEGHSAENFAAINVAEEGAPRGVWDLLALKEADGKTLTYKSVEDAMKEAHKINVAYIKALIKKHPKEFDIDEDKIYAKKLQEKQEGEEEHVGTPGGGPTGDESISEEINPKDPAEAMEMFTKQHKAKIAAAKNA